MCVWQKTDTGCVQSNDIAPAACSNRGNAIAHALSRVSFANDCLCSSVVHVIMSEIRESYASGVSRYTDEDEVVNYQENGSASSSYDTGSEVPSDTAAAAGTSNTTNLPEARQKKQFAISTRWEREVAANGMPRDFSSYFCCCSHRIGNMFILWEKADGSPIVIAGPCWPFCVGVTVPLIIGISGVASYFVFFTSNSNVPIWVAYIYYPILAMVLICLFCVSCRDPGLMERVTDEEAGQGGWFWNEQVGSFRPPGALYCRECGVSCEGDRTS